MMWSLAACTFHAHPLTVFCIFQTYSINLEKARKCSKEKKSQSFVLCPTGSFEIGSHLQTVLPCVKPAEMLWHCRTDSSFTEPESAVAAPGGLHTQPSTSHWGSTIQNENLEAFFRHSAHHSPFSQRRALPSFHALLRGGSWNHICKSGHKATRKKSCYYFCLLVLFNMSSPLVCK